MGENKGKESGSNLDKYFRVTSILVVGGGGVKIPNPGKVRRIHRTMTRAKIQLP